jgi:hypothetical protein
LGVERNACASIRIEGEKAANCLPYAPAAYGIFL